MTLTSQQSSPLIRLRQVLAVDSIVTTANGLIYLAVSGPVGRLLGVPSELSIIAGGFLVAYGFAVGILASRTAPATSAVRTVIIINGAWVVASLLALIAGWIEPSTTGLVWIPMQAAVVAAFAAAQLVYLRRWGGA